MESCFKWYLCYDVLFTSYTEPQMLKLAFFLPKTEHVDDVIALKTILFCRKLLLVSDPTIRRQYCRFVQRLIDVKRQYITPPPPQRSQFNDVITQNCDVLGKF